MHNRSIRLLALVLGAVVMPCVTLWAADPIVGTWKLNLAKSKYNPGPPPVSETRTYEVVKEGLKATVATIGPDGKSNTAEFPMNYDGRYYTMTGDPQFDKLSLTRVDDRTSEATLLHGEMVVGAARRTVSADGKTMTITYKGRDGEGLLVENVTVYDKQP